MSDRFEKINLEKYPLSIAWLTAFTNCVQTRDYDAGKLLFQDDLLSYGTVMESSMTLSNLVDTQWSKVWGYTEGFVFDMENTYLLGGDESSVVVIGALWSSTSTGDMKQLRKGRCTITLVKDTVGEHSLKAIHTHFSIIPDGKITRA